MIPKFEKMLRVTEVMVCRVTARAGITKSPGHEKSGLRLTQGVVLYAAGFMPSIVRRAPSLSLTSLALAMASDRLPLEKALEGSVHICLAASSWSPAPAGSLWVLVSAATFVVISSTALGQRATQAGPLRS